MTTQIPNPFTVFVDKGSSLQGARSLLIKAGLSARYANVLEEQHHGDRRLTDELYEAALAAYGRLNSGESQDPVEAPSEPENSEGDAPDQNGFKVVHGSSEGEEDGDEPLDSDEKDREGEEEFH